LADILVAILLLVSRHFFMGDITHGLLEKGFGALEDFAKSVLPKVCIRSDY